MLWIAINHVLLWNFIFTLSESVELNEDNKLLRNRVRYSTHICDCLKNAQPVVDHNNYETLPDSDGVDHFENPGLAKDLSEPSYPVKRHAISQCYNHPAQQNNKPYKPDLVKSTSEWQIKYTPVNKAYSDSMFEKSKIVGLKKNEFNSQKVAYRVSLTHTAPLLQKGNLIGKNPKHSLLQSNLQDTTNQIESLISAPQHKLGEIISGKLVDDSLHNKLAHPLLTLPLPYKLIKYPAIKPLVQTNEIHTNVNTAGLITGDKDKQSSLLKLSELSPDISNNPKDLIIENKPFSPFPSIKFNKPKLVNTLYDSHLLPIAYQPTPSQLIQTHVIKPIHMPILVQKEASLANDQLQANMNGIAESTSHPILIKKYVSIPSSPKKQQESIDLPFTQPTKTSDTDKVHKSAIVKKEVSISSPYKKQPESMDLAPTQLIITKNGVAESTSQLVLLKKDVSIPLSPKKQQKPIDLPLTQSIKTSDTDTANKPIKIMEKKVPIYFPQKSPKNLINLSPPKKIMKFSDTETVHESIKIEDEISTSALNKQKQPIVDSLLQSPQHIKTSESENGTV